MFLPLVLTALQVAAVTNSGDDVRSSYQTLFDLADMPVQLDGDKIRPSHYDLPIAERKSPRSRRLPKRYRDMLPEPPPSLPPTLHSLQSSSQSTAISGAPEISDSPPAGSTSSMSLVSRAFQYIRTPRNCFGLIRRFFSTRVPTHDPDDLVLFSDLCDKKDPANSTPDDPSSASPQSNSSPSFYPFPNSSSFHLSHWYWNGGIQKSKESFKELVTIVTDPDFNPSDIRHTKWDKVHDILASDEVDETGWIEDMDAGWRKAQIRISVPFHSRTAQPGPSEYTGADLYYRCLLDIIKEKVTNIHDFKHFHLEPYQLLWQPSDDGPEVRVHGELYTSEAFIDAHRELQESPREPGCDLPRVVVGLMLWSDSTQQC
jgi:hypothetical protein